MPFQLSPGVEIQEKDLTLIVPAVATTAGAFVGSFVWGPVNERILVDSEKNLRLLFGAPADDNVYSGSTTGINGGAVDFLTASAFLAYGNNLQVVRVVNTNANNANSAGTTSNIIIRNEDHYTDLASFGTSYGKFAAKYPGTLGNSLLVSVCDNFGGVTSGTQVYRIIGSTSAVGTFASIPSPDPETALSGASVGLSSLSNSVSESNTGFKLLSAAYNQGTYTFYVQGTGASFDTAIDGLATSGNIYLHFSSSAVFTVAKDSDGDFEIYESASTDISSGTAYNVWAYRDNFEQNPSTSNYAASASGTNDEMHIIVIDKDGTWTGTPGTVLERFPYVSKSRDAKKDDGTSNYYVDVLRENSKYVWATDLTWETDDGSQEFSQNASGINWGSFGARDFPLSGGKVGSMPSAAQIVTGYSDYFSDPETVDISLLIGNGAASEANAKTIADSLITIAESRKDCVAFISPCLSDVTGSSPLNDIIEFRNRLSSSSYAVINSGWKLRFDAYNDVNRYIPLTGDLAGLCVRTDRLADSWFSPAGFNRGQIRNVVKLPFNPTKVQRDRLYAAGINPVVTFPSEGTVLFGDKTMLSRPSAFDRINVRRLFIVLEKSIATASRYIMFEFNDQFTQAQFRNLVEPFLRNVQGRQGITDYRVICDSSNNTPDVIDSNNFVADIFIKPARSINFIQLNFIATPTGLSFDEVVG